MFACFGYNVHAMKIIVIVDIAMKITNYRTKIAEFQWLFEILFIY
ncbi:hypothetical protein [Cuniculiplasma thermophilum]